MPDIRRPLKIAFVSNTSWSLYNFRLGIIRNLIARGMEVHLIAPEDEFSEKLLATGCEFHPIKMSPFSYNPFVDLILFLQLYANYRTNKFDLLFHFTIKPNIYGSLAARILGLKYITITTGLGRIFDMPSKWMTVLSLYLFRVANAKSCELWFLNRFDCRVMSRYGKINLSRMSLMPSEGIDTSRFRPKSRSTGTETFRFLFAGRLLVDKGVYEFIEAAKQIRKKFPQTRFDILGFIEHTNRRSIGYEEMHRWQEEGYIRYHGSVEDVRPYINRAHCVVHPSYYREGMSRVLLEAAAMSKPILCTDIPGCREIVRNGWNGFLFRKKSTEQLIERIERILELEDWELKLMGERGRMHVREHFEDSLVQDYYVTKIDCFLPEYQEVNTPGRTACNSDVRDCV